MKTNDIIILCTIFFVSSCSSGLTKRKVLKQHDSLAGESLYRSIDKESKDPIAQCHQGNFDDALREIKEKFSHDSFEYWYSSSNCYFLKNELKKSSFFIDIALTKASNNIEKSIVYNLKGLIFQKYNIHYQAHKLFEKAENLNPASRTIKLNIIFSLINRAQCPSALKKINEIPKNNDIDLLTAEIHCLIKTNREKQAVAMINKIDPYYYQEDDLSLHLSYLLYKTQSYDKSLKILMRASYNSNPLITKSLREMRKIVDYKLEKKK